MEKKEVNLKKIKENFREFNNYITDKLDSEIIDLENASIHKRYSDKVNEIISS